MSTEIETVPPSDSAGIASSGSSEVITQVPQDENNPTVLTPPDQVHRAKSSRMSSLINSLKPKKRSRSVPQLPSVATPSVQITPHSVCQPLPVATAANAKSQESPLYRLVSRELEYIEETSKQLKKYGGIVDKKLQDALNKLELIKKAINESASTQTPPQESTNSDTEDIEKELRQFKKYIRKMKLPIPPKFKINSEDLNAQLNFEDSTQSAKQFATSRLMGGLPKLHNNPMFETSPAIKDFESRYAALDINKKLCLLCFSVFPQGEVIKKRLMVYWWIGEGFVRKQQSKDLEQVGAEYFNELIKRDFIYPSDQRSLEVDSCKMHPFVRSFVITLAARAKFFDFDANGKPKAACPSSFRACLIGNDGLDNDHDFEKLHALFNVDETILDIKPEWFPKMRNVNVLCLGRWQAKANHHIEVEDTKFLEGLRHMEHLKFLSLQGISRIMELPNSVTKLGNLTILDLRACHNLEVIPKDIGLLKSLTHLDMSECYLLDKMPKGLSLLKNLLVLKGFVVVDSKESCRLVDLVKLKKLRKLSIFTGLRNFPEKRDLNAFPQFEVLRKLKVVWGGGANQMKSEDLPEDKNQEQIQNGKTKDGSQGNAAKNHSPANGGDNSHSINPSVPTPAPPPPTPAAVAAPTPAAAPSTPAAAAPVAAPPAAVTEPARKIKRGDSLMGKMLGGTQTDHVSPGLPEKLVKLDLQCFPKKTAPDWLKPNNLQSLEKLYIRGGQLSDLGGRVDPWKVKTLRLKYLNGLGMNWMKLRKLFPELVYLEKVECPKLSLFPCDEAGVWVDKK